MDKRLFVFMKHGEKARTLVHFFCRKSYEPCPNKEVMLFKILKRCEKFTYLRLWASRLKFYNGHLLYCREEELRFL